jgi:hypothetical protein
MPSIEPRKEFFDFYEVDYKAETVTKKNIILSFSSDIANTIVQGSFEQYFAARNVIL